MWGQGLERTSRFSAVFQAAVKSVTGHNGAIVWDKSRSGAKIREQGPEREAFIDTYPHLFTNATNAAAFRSGQDNVASGLYGEIPSTFPTIRGQIAMIPAATAATIDVALVDGGLNDVGIEDIIDPRVAPGQYIEHFDGVIRLIAFDNVRLLLTDLRARCPKAVILYFGAHGPVSYLSNRATIKSFMRHEFDDDFKWWLNEHLGVVDTDAMVYEAVNRGVWFRGRWQYWTRQAVASLAADDTQRGPGILYVPSTFDVQNAAFAQTQWVWADFTDPTTDPARSKRLAELPRFNVLDGLRSLHRMITRGDSEAGARDAARRLLPRLNGPSRLKRDLQDYIDGRQGARELVFAGLSAEVGRIQHALTASLFHPNGHGDAAWADEALRRYANHLTAMDTVAKESQPGFVPALGVETLDATLRRCGLRSSGSLSADATHLDVDSIAVITRTAANSDRNLGEAFALVVRTDSGGVVTHHQFLLTSVNLVNSRQAWEDDHYDPIRKPYPWLEPGIVNRFTVDTMGKTRLTEIVGCFLLLGPDPYDDARIRRKYGLTWIPDSIRLEINGVQVRELTYFNTIFGPNDQIDLGWPAPLPQRPVIKMVLPPAARVRKPTKGAPARAAKKAAPVEPGGRRR